MAIVKSMLFGSEGSYNILGVPVTFRDETNPLKRKPESAINRAFDVATFLYAHAVVHQWCHAVTCFLLLGQVTKVEMVTNSFNVETIFPPSLKKASPWKNSVVDLAGPMGGIAFATCRLVAAIVLRTYISWPVALVLGAGAAFCLAGELMTVSWQAFIGKGDFGSIKNRGIVHLTLASTVLAAQCALGIFAAIKLRG